MIAYVSWHNHVDPKSKHNHGRAFMQVYISCPFGFFQYWEYLNHHNGSTRLKAVLYEARSSSKEAFITFNKN